MKYAILALLLLAGCAEGGGNGSASSCALVRKTVLPVVFQDGEPIIAVTVNGVAGHMILDTGSGITTFTLQARDRFTLPDDQTQRTNLSGIGNSSGHYNSFVETMQFGDITVHSLSKLAVDMRFSKGITADGIVGSDLLKDYDVDLDLAHGQVIVYNGRNCPEQRPDWTATAELLPPSSLRRALGANFTSVEVDGKPANAEIDSGATSIVIERSFAATLGVTDDVLKQDRQGQVLGVGTKTAPSALHTFKTLKVGSQTIARPRLVVTALGTTNLVHDYQILLGEPYLRTHRVWISYPGYQVYTASAVRP